MDVLKTVHNAGFFSCCTFRLLPIMKYFNENGRLPDAVDSSEQFFFYKNNPAENLVPLFFKDGDNEIPAGQHIATNEPREISFSDYSKLQFQHTTPFVRRYFTLSNKVSGIVWDYEQKYGIDYENTCAIFYRGNDKIKEGDLVPYEQYAEKARALLAENPNIRFLVQPDETEFLEYFIKEFPDRCFFFSETPHMRKKLSAIFFELPLERRANHACYFLAATYAISKCKHIITHSGNGGMWAVLFRGNFENVHQFIVNHIY